MEKTNKNNIKEIDVLNLNFSLQNRPIEENRYNKGSRLIEWGDNNSKPQQLLELYNYYGSSEHKAIINKKTKFVAGQGIEKTDNEIVNNIFANSAIDTQVYNAALCFEIYDGFAFEIIRNRAGNIHSIKHIPFHKLRLALEEDGWEINDDFIWFSRDWQNKTKARNRPIGINLFKQDEKFSKSIYYFKNYNPQNDDEYPIPSYSTSISWNYLYNSMRNWHINQVDRGYTPSLIISFNDGQPPEEVQEANAQNIARAFRGVNGENAMITYSSGKEFSPEINAFPLNDSDKRFATLMAHVKSEIIISHELPPALLELTAGKLASTDERFELMVEFQRSYVEARQKQIETALNEILSSDGHQVKTKLKTYLETSSRNSVDTNNEDVKSTNERI